MKLTLTNQTSVVLRFAECPLSFQPSLLNWNCNSFVIKPSSAFFYCSPNIFSPN